MLGIGLPAAVLFIPLIRIDHRHGQSNRGLLLDTESCKCTAAPTSDMLDFSCY